MNKDEALKMAIEALPELISTAQTEYDSQAKAYEGYPNMAYRYIYLKDIADDGTKAINACKEALEQPAQEPVAWREVIGHTTKHYEYNEIKKGEPLYTSPQPCQECESLKHDLDVIWEANKELLNKEWQELTDDEIAFVVNDTESLFHLEDFARAIEQALKEKNTC